MHIPSCTVLSCVLMVEKKDSFSFQNFETNETIGGIKLECSR